MWIVNIKFNGKINRKEGIMYIDWWLKIKLELN